MTKEEVLKEIASLNRNLVALNQNISDYINSRIDDTNNTQFQMLGLNNNNLKDIKLIAKQQKRFDEITLQNSNLTDEQKMEVADLYPLWEVDKKYEMGVILKWGWNADNESQLWEVLQTHISQADWTPDKAVSLFKKIGFDEQSGYPIWTQPLGSSDAYQKGDIVVFEENGKTYESTIDNNVWAPNVYGWIEYKE